MLKNGTTALENSSTTKLEKIRPEILKSKLRLAVDKMNKNKAARSDGVTM